MSTKCFLCVCVLLISYILKILITVSFQSDQQNGRWQSGREMKCYYQGTYCLCAISFGNSSARSSHTLNGSPRRWEAFHQPCGNLHERLRLSRLERGFKEVKGGEETEMERQLLEYEAWIKWFTLEQLLIRSWSCASQGASEVTPWWCVTPVNIFLGIYVMLARETVRSSATYSTWWKVEQDDFFVFWCTSLYILYHLVWKIQVQLL